MMEQKQAKVPSISADLAEAMRPIQVAPSPRQTTSVICELAYERREIADNLAKLRAAIVADPQSVRTCHKQLWKQQAKAMQEYVDVLGERIKDLIDNG